MFLSIGSWVERLVIVSLQSPSPLYFYEWVDVGVGICVGEYLDIQNQRQT